MPEPVLLGTKIVLVYTMPFWLSHRSTPRYAQDWKRKSALFAKLAHSMNTEAQASEYASRISFEHWELPISSTDERVPDGLARRKGAFIRSNDFHFELDDLVPIVDQALYKHGIQSDHNIRLIYYDYGVGYCDYRITIFCDNKRALARLASALADLSVILIAYQENGQKKLHTIMAFVDDALLAQCGDAGVIDNWLLAKQNAHSRLTWAFSGSIVSLIESDAAVLALAEEEFISISNHFVDEERLSTQTTRPVVFPGFGSLTTIHGDVGSFVIFDTRGFSENACHRQERIFLLISLGWMFSSVMIEGIEATYTRLVESVDEESVNHDAHKIAEARNIMELIQFECQCLAMCTTRHDYFVYEGLCEAADYRGSTKSFEEASNILGILIDDIRQFEVLRVRKIAKRVAAFGLGMGLLATLATIFSYIDRNESEIYVIQNWFRLAIVIGFLVCSAAMALVVYARDRDVVGTRFLRRPNS